MSPRSAVRALWSWYWSQHASVQPSLLAGVTFLAYAGVVALTP